MSYQLPRIISASGRNIVIAHLDISNQPVTYLSNELAALGTTATILNNAGFANTNLCLIGKLGSEKTESKSVNGAVSAGTSMTITAATFGHAIGTEVRKILFDQFKIYGTATNVFATDNLLATVGMSFDAPSTTYVNAGTEYAYYWAVPYDSVNAITGDNSDSIQVSEGNPTNSVGFLLDSSLRSCKKAKGGTITDEWLISEINDCSEYIASKLKRWSHLQSFNYVLGQSTMGTNKYTFPSDIQDKNSIKSILGIRVGGDAELTYLDKKDWNSQLKTALHTQVRTQALAADTTLDIDNSYDFEDTGSVDVYVSGVKYTYTYTGVTRSATAGVLTGVPASGTGAITVTTPVDSEVWYNADEGKPIYFDVYDGSLYIYPLPDASYDKLNVYLDYFTSRTRVNSSSDVIEPIRYLLYKHWLCWKIKALDNASGELNLADGDFALFTQMLGDFISKEISGQKYRMKPRVNKISY